MKYTTFRNTLLAGTALAAVGGAFYFGRPSPPVKGQVDKPSPTAAERPPATDPPPPVPPPIPTLAQALAASPTANAVEATDSAGSGQKGSRIPLRELDRELLQLYTQAQAPGAKTTKVKDVFPKRPYKVNLYVEGDRLVRAKVDLNRNGKWDEKWSFEQAGAAPVIKRQVSPADDDTHYSLTYKVAGQEWVQK